MRADRPPRERTFGEIFPWRNIRRAVLLVVLLMAILAIKRDSGGFINRLMQSWTPPPAAPALPHRGAGGPAIGATDAPSVRLGPGFSPPPVRDVGKTASETGNAKRERDR